MKRLIACICILCLFPVLPVRAYTPSAASCALYDPLTGRFLYEKDSRTVRPMASTTKIMTALAALELYDPDQPVTIEREWTGIEGSSMYLKPGERLTVEDLLYGLMLMSGNDAAVALASLLTGEQADFIRYMNERAGQVGLTDTCFVSPNGLDGGGHGSTAADMAILTAVAMEHDLFRTIAAAKSIEKAGRYMQNHNKLLTLYPDAVGVKTGYTKKAGRCLVSAAERQGRTLIAVTLNAPDDWKDHMELYNDGFAGMEQRQLLERGHLASVPAANGKGQMCGLFIQEDLALGLLPGEQERIEIRLHGPRMVYGPITKGETYGYVTVTLDGQELFRTPLYFEEDIEAETPEASFWQKLLDRMLGK